MPNRNKPIPLAYFITFTTYGSWLHGDLRTWVDRDHNEYGTERLSHDPLVHHVHRRKLKHEPIELNAEKIRFVRDAILEVCNYRGWKLISINVRTNHVHVLAMANCEPEKLLGDFKRYATRRLRREGAIEADRPVWTDGGSTIYLWDQGALDRVDRYIRYGQGEDLGGRV